MTGQVPRLSRICMGITCFTVFALPVFLYFWFRKKKNADRLPFFTGILVMSVFVFTLEQLVHNVILSTSFGKVILNNLLLYALYGGLMAALFEECGRYAAFSTILRNSLRNDSNALMYGAGHGGLEAAVIGGTTMINNLVYSGMINRGTLPELTPEAAAQLMPALNALVTAPSWQFLLAGVERIFALILQIALSMLVFAAVKHKKKELFFSALFLHFMVDAVSTLLSGAGMNPIILEAVVGAFALAGVIVARSAVKDAGLKS